MSRKKLQTKADSYKFNYIYTCDIEDARFRVKVYVFHQFVLNKSKYNFIIEEILTVLYHHQ